MVEINVERKCVQVTWDTSVVQGDTVRIEATNVDTGDTSNRDAKNAGKAVLTYPADYHGSSAVTVFGSDGGEDAGTIEV